MPFYGLVKRAQESFAKQYTKQNIFDYHEKTYTVEIDLTSKSFNYLNELYSDNNSSILDQGAIFTTGYTEE